MTRTNHLLLLSLLVICPVLSIRAEEPNDFNWLEGKLQIVTVTKPIVYATQEFKNISPTHVAVFWFKGIGFSLNDIRSTPSWNKLSKAQQTLCSSHPFGISKGSGKGLRSTYDQFHLLAVSEKDARILARALVVDVIAEYYLQELQTLKDKISAHELDLSSQVALGTKKQQDLIRVEKEYQHFKAGSRFISLSRSEADQAATAAVIHLGTLEDEVNIQLAQVQSRLSVIQTYTKEKKLADNILDTLLEQQVQQVIELTALEARRRSIEQHLKEYNDFLRVSKQLDELSRKQVPNLQREIDSIRDNLSARKEDLADLQEELSSAILDHKITIHPWVRTQDREVVLSKRRAELMHELAEHRRTLTPTHPRIKETIEKLKGVEDQLSVRRNQ